METVLNALFPDLIINSLKLIGYHGLHLVQNAAFKGLDGLAPSLEKFFS